MCALLKTLVINLSSSRWSKKVQQLKPPIVKPNRYPCALHASSLSHQDPPGKQRATEIIAERVPCAKQHLWPQ